MCVTTERHHMTIHLLKGNTRNRIGGRTNHLVLTDKEGSWRMKGCVLKRQRQLSINRLASRNCQPRGRELVG